MKNREIGIDLLRIFCCFGIIVLHESGRVIDHTFYWNITNSFVRPCLMIFFSISGYFILNKKINSLYEFYTHEISKLMIPLIIYSWIYFIPIESIKNLNFLEIFKGLDIMSTLAGDRVGILWFVYTLIGLYLITPFLQVMLKNMTDKYLFAFLFILSLPTIIAPSIATFFNKSILFDIPMATNGLLYFVLGYTLSRINILKHRKKIYFFGVVNIVVSIALFFKPNYISYIVNNSPMLIIYLLFYYVLFHDIGDKIGSGFGRRIIVFISTRTFGIYLIHYYVFFTILPKIKIFELSTNNYTYMILIRYLFIFVVSLIVSYIIDRFIIRPMMFIVLEIFKYLKIKFNKYLVGELK